MENPVRTRTIQGVRVAFRQFPPNYEDIVAALPAVGHSDSVLFTYGDTVYMPHSDEITTDLIAHESVHIRQQNKMGMKAWWKKYLVDPEFRLSQEVEAYRVQNSSLGIYTRDRRRFIQNKISKDLAGPFYGNLIGKHQAKQLIKEK